MIDMDWMVFFECDRKWWSWYGLPIPPLFSPLVARRKPVLMPLPPLAVWLVVMIGAWSGRRSCRRWGILYLRFLYLS